MSATVAIEPEVIEVLKTAEINEQLLRITAQLERDLYVKVNDVLNRLGGKWKGGKTKAHVFPEGLNPANLIEEIVESGVKPPKNPLAFFATPSDIAAQMIEMMWQANPSIEPNRILEPSAGEGAIADAFDDKFQASKIWLIEINSYRAGVLGRKGYKNVSCTDFLTVQPAAYEELFDVVAMNPPFSVEGDSLAYITHIKHAQQFVRNGGVVVAIAPAGFASQGTKKVKAFREFVEDNGVWQELPEGAFKESGTGIRTVMLAFRVDREEPVSITEVEVEAQSEPAIAALPPASTEPVTVGQCRVSVSDLKAAFSSVDRAVPSRPVHPILANVLLCLDASRQILAMTAFDLALGIAVEVPVSCGVQGFAIAAPAKLLGRIVGSLTDEELKISVDLETLTVRLQTATSDYSLQGMGSEDFPRLEAPEGSTFSAPAQMLLGASRNTFHAASMDEAKQILTGVRVSYHDERLEFAATDGHRLTVSCTEATGLDGLELTVPLRSMQELRRLAIVGEQTLRVVCDRSYLRAEGNGWVLTTRLLEGQYPNYRQLIPKVFQTAIRLDRKTFLTSLERVAILADQKNGVVKLTLSKKQQTLTVSVDAKDVGNGSETVACTLSSQAEVEGQAISFNVRYLLDAFKVSDELEINLQMNGPTSPVVLSTDKNDWTELLMPVQIRS